VGRIIYMPLAFKDYSFDSLRPLLMDSSTIFSLSDGGAHCGVICDAGMPTYLLTHWVRERQRGECIPLEWAVMRQTKETAELYGMAASAGDGLRFACQRTPLRAARRWL